VEFEFEINPDKIPYGKYNIFVEVHLAENYNQLYSGTINLSDEQCNTSLSVSYVPDIHPQTASNVLTDIKVICN
jgi:hypothetical protein